MIQLTRQRSETAIPAAFRGVKRIEKALTLHVAAEQERAFDSAYWTRAKKQLKAESGGKCAYCEAQTSVVAHGDVEHFRPKSVYWWLAYCYDNYLYACQICNQIYKGDHFPLARNSAQMVAPDLPDDADDAVRTQLVASFSPDPLVETDGRGWQEFMTACRAERPHLLNPYMDEPEKHFAWEADLVLQEVAVKPRSKAAHRYHKAAEQYYGLNRPELLAERWKTYQKLAVFYKTFTETRISAGLRDEVAAMLHSMLQPEAPFAGMCRHFVRRIWQLPF